MPLPETGNTCLGPASTKGTVAHATRAPTSVYADEDDEDKDKPTTRLTQAFSTHSIGALRYAFTSCVIHATTKYSYASIANLFF